MMDLSKMRDLCNVLGLNPLQRIRDEVDDSIRDITSWSACNLRVETTERLNSSVDRLCEIRSERFNELKKRGLAILSYWDALLVPLEEKQDLICLAYYIHLDSADEITEANALSLEFINKVEQEYHRLSGLLNVLVLKKKSKLEQIRKTAHLSSIVINEDTSDPVAALVAMRAQISRVKAMASERANIVTDIELIQHAYEEVQWYRALEKDNVLVQDARSVKAKVLQKVLTKMLNKVKAELAVFDGPFEFDGVDAESIINAIMEASGMEKATSVADKAFTSVEKTLEKEKTGTSTEKTVVEHEAIGAEAPGVEDMEPGSEQAAGNLLPFLPQFGRKAPRTPRPRRPAQEVPHSPSPPDYKKSDESMRSSPSEISDDSMGSSPSEKSDDSMRSSPSVRSDDSMRSGPSDPDDSDYNPEEDV